MRKKKNKVSVIAGTVLGVIALVLIIAFAFELITELSAGKITDEISLQQAQKLVDDSVKGIPTAISSGAKYIAENMTVKVESVSYGLSKDAIFACSFESLNVKDVLGDKLDSILVDVYKFYEKQIAAGKKVNATALQVEFGERVMDIIKTSEKIEGSIEITAYQVSDGSFQLYLSDNVVNTLYGGLIDVRESLAKTYTLEIDGKDVDISNKNTLRTGIDNIIAFRNYSSELPETGGKIIAAFNSFIYEFQRNFIDKDMWKYLANGLVTTLELTGCSLLLGIFLGVVIAVIRVTHDKMKNLPILNKICGIYLSIIRGTPVMVQILIIYFVILSPLNVNKFLSAVVCFGINSGAYVAEIIRGGIASIDVGQTEAGRSLGLSYTQTMTNIVIPQAFKVVLPSLANEFIALIKETSIAFYIGVTDLMQGGLRIRSITYSNFMPLIAVAVIYLVIVIILTRLVSLLEKKLKQSER